MKLAISAVVLAGCWGSTPSTPPERPASGPAIVTEPERVHVESTGAGPRRRLRYRLAPHSTERMEMDLTMSNHTHMEDPTFGARDTNANVPTMRSRMKVDVVAVDPANTATIDFLYEDARMAPDAQIAAPMRAQLDAVLAKFVGLRGHAKISVRGSTKDLAFELPPNADPVVSSSLDQMKEQMRNFYVALPDEAVGIGARWDIIQSSTLLGASIETRLRYTLLSIDRDMVTCEATVTQSAVDQPLEINGMKGTLRQLSSEGHGRIQFPLDSLVPTGTLAMASNFEFALGADGVQTVATVKLEVGVKTRPVK